MTARLLPMSLLLFSSGFCALVYQTAWTRMFRLLFGASTLAAAATLAVFMGGLGLGGWLLGRRVENHPRPLALYGQVELLIAVLAAASVGFLGAASWVYHATGGSQALGVFGATALRLLLATLVMGPSAVLMGATMPAAARVVTSAGDSRRDAVAVLIGINTLGAVTGVLLTTFFLLEVLGTTDSLYCAALLNLLVGVVALRLARTSLGEPVAAAQPASVDEEAAQPTEPASGVIVAAGLVGFAFMLMELVWYRMLSPILGGSTYTFGLVLAVALLGIGLGGGAYAFLGRGRVPTIGGLAVTCAAEALALVFPLFLGDRIALMAAFARPASVLGFPWLMGGWALVCLLVVFPAAFISGYQFPLLIGLLGHGRKGVGREVGLTYAANTFGSIIGSLAGGFGLIPALTAVGAWKLGAFTLLFVAAAALISSVRRAGPGALRQSGAAAALGLLTIPCFVAEGPTALWRHSSIGAGRSSIANRTSLNVLKDKASTFNRTVVWERDGVESSVAVMFAGGGLSFVVNGKTDGNAIIDSGTQVMSGLIGAALHGSPRTALVIGLGTGSTAGWLARVPTIEHLDVAEIEPVILDVGRACHEVNEEVMTNPKVTLHLEDARELMLTSKSQFDLIFSEPSNPYRAGIASLYTREFYTATRAHLAPGGMLLQWLQGYEVDAETVRTVLVTLGSVFPFVDVWQTQSGDLILRAMEAPPRLDDATLRARLATEPYLTAMRSTWTSEGLEEFLAHYVAGDALTRVLVEQYPGAVNTDDLNFVEFAFAQSVGKSRAFSVNSLRSLAISGRADRPGWLEGTVDWSAVAETRAFEQLRERPDSLSPEGRARLELVTGKNRRAAVAAYKAQPFGFSGPREELLMASFLADEADEGALGLAKSLEGRFGAESAAIIAWLRLRQGDLPQATDALILSLERTRKQVFVASQARLPELLLAASRGPLAQDKGLALRLFTALERPLPAFNLEPQRREARTRLSGALGPAACVPAFKEQEPHVPWDQESLRGRLACYQAAGDPLVARARADLEAYLAAEPSPLLGAQAPDDAEGGAL